MKVSLITVCYRPGRQLAETLDSILAQSHPAIETILVDGASPDAETQQVIARYRARLSTVLVEPDDGVYHTMAKGVALATGEVIGFVNAGDTLMHGDVVREVADAFAEGVDAVYGDIDMVDARDTRRVRRRWVSGPYDRNRFRKGWMPPHVATFIRRRIYEQYGSFNTTLDIAADYEVMFRFMYRHRIAVRYVPSTWVRFRLGGLSNGSLQHVLRANTQVRRSWRLNGIAAPPLLVTRKLLSKVLQFLH